MLTPEEKAIAKAEFQKVANDKNATTKEKCDALVKYQNLVYPQTEPSKEELWMEEKFANYMGNRKNHEESHSTINTNTNSDDIEDNFTEMGGYIIDDDGVIIY